MKTKILALMLLSTASTAQAASFAFHCVNNEYSIEGNILKNSKVEGMTFRDLSKDKNLPAQGVKYSAGSKGRRISFSVRGYGYMTLVIQDNLDNSYGRAKGVLQLPGPDLDEARNTETLSCAGETID